MVNASLIILTIELIYSMINSKNIILVQLKQCGNKDFVNKNKHNFLLKQKKIQLSLNINVK